MADYLSNLQKQGQGYLNQLNELNKTIKTYTPVTMSDALRDFSGRIGNMAPQYGELRGMESQLQQLPGSSMQQFQQAFGGTTGLDPMARLNAIQAQMGNVRGTTNVMRDVIGQQQGRLEQMANSAVGAYQQELAQRQQQWQNLNDMYKTALSQIEAEKARRAAAAAASGFGFGGGGGGTGGGIDKTGGGPVTVVSDKKGTSSKILAGASNIMQLAGTLSKNPIVRTLMLSNPAGAATWLMTQGVNKAQIPQLLKSINAQLSQQGGAKNLLSNLYNNYLGGGSGGGFSAGVRR